MNFSFNFSYNFLKNFLIDAGGGQKIYYILLEKNIELTEIHDIFISHAHTDHILGLIWLL